ncbi:hypothetical protein TWF718_010537 [Orbilia javanica]|uniref:Uncharacterized protein n=1 Tax=Orbilia javanica TaxID=47235 RepID=A0AAN8REF1_9PEZI
MHFSIVSLALLAASAIPSVVAQGRPNKNAYPNKTTITKTFTKTVTLTSKTWSFRHYTTTKLELSTTTKTEHYTITTVKKEIIKPPPVTVTETVTKCPTNNDGGEKGEEGEGETPVKPAKDEEVTFETCPPIAVVTATPSCKGGTPCPTKSLCSQSTPTVTYRCNCGGATRTTVTATPRCAEDCCGGYVPTLYTFVPLPVERCVQPFGVSEVLI